MLTAALVLSLLAYLVLIMPCLIVAGRSGQR